MSFIKFITRIILKLIGYVFVILGQGLLVLTTISGCLMNAVTGFLFLMAIILSFSDLPLSYKIVYWVMAIISGVIATNIYTLPQRLVSIGRRLSSVNFN